MPRQIREILASVREEGGRGRNMWAPEKYGRSGNPSYMVKAFISMQGHTRWVYHISSALSTSWRFQWTVVESACVQTRMYEHGYCWQYGCTRHACWLWCSDVVLEARRLQAKFLRPWPWEVWPWHRSSRPCLVALRVALTICLEER